MVIDSSFLVAIALRESDALEFVEAIQRDSVRLLAAPTKVVSAIVLIGRTGSEGRADLDALIADLGIVVEPFGDEQAEAAVAAFTRFGRGRGGPLNFRGWFAYALARISGQPLLFKGNDSARTDIASAI